jgi:hypothetical protein
MIDTIDDDKKALQLKPQIVTKEFLDLAQHIDSSGFICDSARFKKTYRRVNQQRPIKIEDYLFYELTLEETVPILEHMRHVEWRDEVEMNREIPDTAQLNWWKDWKDRWKLNFELFEKAEKITAYFYIEKSFFDGTGSGTHYDGLIEEWEFPDKQSAKDASEDLSKKETMVYINRGAYICYLDKYMYVFHTRSAGFYTPLKKFLTYFADKNNANIPNKREQRKNY